MTTVLQFAVAQEKLEELYRSLGKTNPTTVDHNLKDDHNSFSVSPEFAIASPAGVL